MADSRLVDARPAPLATVLSAAAIPYGVTTVVSSDVLLLRHYHHEPKVGQVFAFAIASVIGYGVLTSFARPSTTMGAVPARLLLRTGALHVLAISFTLLLVVAIAQLPPFVAWPLGGATGIASYLSFASLQYRFVLTRSRD